MTQTETSIRTAGIHTPGPWTVGGVNGIGQRTVRASDGCRIAQVDEQFLATSAYNAHLIAAAPDLLAALKASDTSLHMLHERLIGEGSLAAPAVWSLIQSNRAAIAKAEGRS
jgi:hypothetical protein